MSTLLRVLLPLTILCALTTPVAAGDEDPKPPIYYVEHLMPGEDDAPEGWKMRDEAKGSGRMTEAQLAAVAQPLGLGDDDFYVEYRVFVRGGKEVPVAMLDVESKVRAFHTALAAKSAETGWHIRELGSPTRVMVVDGSDAAASKLTEALVEHCVYALSEIAMNRVRGRSGEQEEGRAAALAVTKAMESFSPKAGTTQAVIGVVHWIKAMPERGKKDAKHDRAEQELAVKCFARSLEDGVPYPPKGSVLVFAAGQLGQMLLTFKDESKLDQAMKAVELAVKNERDAKTQRQRFGNRYNLSCCYARKNRIDDAFKYLESALEVGKSMPQGYYRAQYENISDKDEDMVPLRRDPRFSELMKRFKPPDKKKTG